MKNVIIPLFFPLLMLAGCSGKQANTSLEISRAFAVSNSAFTGGLIITGRKLNSIQSFSVGLDGSTSINLQLDAGTWFFSAVGWDGGATPKPFGGEPLCGWTQKDLSNPEETIDLVISKEKCAQAAANGAYVFAGSNDFIDTTPAIPTLKKLSTVIGCNSFYTSVVNPGDNPADFDVNRPGEYPNAYCDNLPEDLRGELRSFRLLSVNKLPGELLPKKGLDSGCFNMDAGSTVSTLAGSGQPFSGEVGPRLPYNSIPFIIQAYKDSDCNSSDLMTSFYFPKGLQTGNPSDFDHHLRTASSTNMKLLLPGSDLRRGRSPFMALLPFFAKSDVTGTSISQFETVPSTQTPDFHMPTYSTVKFILENEALCGTLSTSNASLTISCSDLGDTVEVSLSFNSSGDWSETFTVNGNTYSVQIADNANYTQRYKTQKLLVETLGLSNDLSPETFFFPQRKNRDFEYAGVLTQVRDMLTANGAGGVIGIQGTPLTFTQACQEAVGTKEIGIFNYEEMLLEKYKVSVSNSPLNTPSSYLCNIDNKSEDDCAANGALYEKRMLIYDYKYSAMVPFMSLEFSCTAQLGRMELSEKEREGVHKTVMNQIVSWNTEIGSSVYADQRLEILQWSIDYKFSFGTNSFNPEHEQRRMTRLSKTDYDDFELTNFEFDARFNTGYWDQTLDMHQVTTVDSKNICYTKLGSPVTNSDPYNIFSTSPHSNSLPASGAVSTSDPSYEEYDLTAAWGPSDQQCNSQTYADLSNPVITDVDLNGVDDNNADKLDGNLVMKPGSLNDPNFTQKFDTGLFAPLAP